MSIDEYVPGYEDARCAGNNIKVCCDGQRMLGGGECKNGPRKEKRSFAAERIKVPRVPFFWRSWRTHARAKGAKGGKGKGGVNGG